MSGTDGVYDSHKSCADIPAPRIEHEGFTAQSESLKPVPLARWREYKILEDRTRAEEPPWHTHPSFDRPTGSNPEGEAVTIIHRYTDRHVHFWDTANPNDEDLGESTAQNSRLCIWGVIKMAEAGVPEKILFTSSSLPRSDLEVFSLLPKPRSSIPLQWGHFSPRSIPDTIAEMPCSALDLGGILAKLNSISGTTFPLTSPGLRPCLEHFLHASYDFGQAYGFLRPHWNAKKLPHFLSNLAREQQADDAMRRDALQGGYIRDARIRPRRVWDLYSNRVLPIYAIVWGREASHIPNNVWTVSHSWVLECSRKYVSSPINRYQWPIPVPQETTLEHVRVELLNLGAEYVWLDVLCLRQRGQDADEETRKKEWSLDVPTIGYVYSTPHIPCITYFNGLGLPLNPSPVALASERHWLKRIWTVQEATSAWLPGGLTGTISADVRTFFQEHHTQAIPERRATLVYHWAFAIGAMQHRFSTTDLDKVHSLAYVLRCTTLPIYDEGMSPELAWALLLKHLSPLVRELVVVQHAWHNPSHTALLPPWKDFILCNKITQDFGRPSARMELIDKASLGSRTPGAYVHAANASGPVRIRRHAVHGTATADESVDLWSPINENTGCTIVGEVYGEIMKDVTYRVLRFSDRIFVVTEVVGEREVQGEKAPIVAKRACIVFRGARDTLPELRIKLETFTVVHPG